MLLALLFGLFAAKPLQQSFQLHSNLLQLLLLPVKNALLILLLLLAQQPLQQANHALYCLLLPCAIAAAQQLLQS